MNHPKMSEEPTTYEDLQGYPTYFWAVGLGIAYGLYTRGFVSYWPLAVAVFSCCWGLRGPLFRTWSYRAYSMERKKIGLQPTPIAFAALQAMSTAALVFAVAFIVIGVRKLLSWFLLPGNP